MKRTRVKTTTYFSEVGGGRNIQSKQAHVLQCKS